MGKDERHHRQDPERTEPIRNPTAGLRESLAWATDAPGAAPPRSEWHEPPGAVDDVVAYAVKVGYDVIEEQIRQGRELAQRLRMNSDETRPKEDSMERLIERVLHAYKDLGAVYLEALEAFARSPGYLSGLARASRQSPAGSGDQAQTGYAAQPGSVGGVAGAPMAVEVASARRVQVTLSPPSFSRGLIPSVHALYAADRSIPPLTRVRFDTQPSSPSLQVEIPDDQYPATYTGVVVDSATNEPVGTLCVRVFA